MIYKTKNDGNIFKQLRSNIGLKQYEVAERLNLQHGAVSAWECGRTVPDQSVLPALAKLYDTTVDYLLSGQKTPQIIEKVIINKPQQIDNIDIVQKFNLLPERQQIIVRAQIDEYLRLNGMDAEEVLKKA